MIRLSLSTRRADLLAIALYATIVAVLALIYLGQAVQAGAGAPLMPVDDAYIHFQYARQAAEGQPFVYNPGQGPTSGATSLLYPFVLALGYKLGFTALNLGYWAYLIGAVALLASALTVRAMSRAAGLTRWLYDVLGASVAAWGALVWHAYSGMETVLVVAFVLLTLHAFERQNLRTFVLAALVLAILRPEASIMAGLAAMLYGLREFRLRGLRRQQLWLMLPVFAVAAQPLLNIMLTGTSSASGSQAKSLLSIVPFDLGYVAQRVAGNFVRAWEGFLLGFEGLDDWMLPPLLGVAALAGLYRLARSRPLTALLVLLWLVGIFAGISALDTAFWHFRRYHMPLLVLAFPLTAHAAALLASRPRIRAGLILWALTAALMFNVPYIERQRLNVEAVAAQPLAMAHWIFDNTPLDALIAVHDVGLVRYIGGRTTLDMVGLTTAGAAESWRNGPGAVGEYLVHALRRPDYFAAYPDARGLSYLADSLYGDQLAGFSYEFDPRTNVALGGPLQGIYAPAWIGASAAAEPRVDAVRRYIENYTLSDMLNVAEITSERAHSYTWRNTSRFDGFATEMYLFETPGCGVDCRVLDGGRRLNGSESFVMSAQPGSDTILVSRVHAPSGGNIRIVINNSLVIERTLPAVPGQFVEIPTLIPAEQAASGKLNITIQPSAPDTLIFPYRHWLYSGTHVSETESSPSITFANDSIGLTPDLALADGLLTVRMNWSTDGTASGDWIAFVHVYGRAALDSPPVLQSDLRPGQGALPPGAWLSGTLSDCIVLDFGGLPADDYVVAVGLYDPVTFERLVPIVTNSSTVVQDRRVLLEIPERVPSC